MKRAAVVLACLLWSPLVGAQELAVSAEGGAGFQRLLTMVQQGRMGPDVKNANIAVSGSSVRIDLIANGGTRSLVLLPPGQEGRWSSRFFELNLGPGARPEDAERLLPLLDEAFSGRDPFVVVERGVRDAGAPQGVESLAHAWQRDGWRGVQTGLVLRYRQPTGPRYVTVVMLLYGLGLLASLVAVFRPRMPTR